MSKFSSKLVDKRVVVIGGSSGMGYAIAEGALEAGAIVTIASSKQARVDKAVESLQASYPSSSSKVNGHVCDLGMPASIEANLTQLLIFASEGGRHKLDHVANTAGVIANVTALADTSFEDLLFDRYVAAMMLGKLAPRYMSTTSPSSSVTFTSGSSIAKPHAGFTTLAPNAGAVEPLARALAVELAPLRFNVVSPGPTDTDLLAGTTGGDSDRARRQWADKTLLGVGHVTDVAEAYLFSMRCNNLTGTIINCDGGAILKS